MLRRKNGEPPPARWPFSLPASTAPERINAIRRRVDELSDAAQYGWVHTIDFGPFTKEGVMKDDFLKIVGHWDALRWWPASLRGLRVADIGCATGGISLLMAHRGAREVLAVDQIPEHIAQCSYLCEVFGVTAVRPLAASLFDLPKLEVGRFDLVVMSGLLYHVSDMLVALLIMRELLEVGGALLIESAAVADDEHSYANFGRFAMGMWWQPSTLCIRDMCQFVGLSELQLRMYRPDRCLGRAVKKDDNPIPFRRGLNYPFADLRDRVERSMDTRRMAPK